MVTAAVYTEIMDKIATPWVKKCARSCYKSGWQRIGQRRDGSLPTAQNNKVSLKFATMNVMANI